MHVTVGLYKVYCSMRKFFSNIKLFYERKTSQRRYEAEEMASMLNDRNEYLEQLEKVGLLDIYFLALKEFSKIAGNEVQIMALTLVISVAMDSPFLLLL